MEVDDHEDEKRFVPDLLQSLELNDAGQIEVLRAFCKKAKSFLGKKHTQDIVQVFLKYPGSCMKLANILNDGKITTDKITLIFNTFHCILLRVNDDLNQFENVVEDAVQLLIQYELRAFCSLLKKNQGYQGPKAALQLLTSIILMGPRYAKALAVQFIAVSNNLSHFAKLRKFEDASDIRTCVVHFIMSFLIVDPCSFLRHVSEQQGILQAIITGLICDKASLIQPFLMALKSKVLENSAVSKTFKVRMLNEQSLTSVFCLLNWKGPKTLSNRKAHRKATSSEEAWILQDATEGEVEIVKMAAFDFLKVACSSRKFGVVLSEDQAQPGRNPNFIIFKVLLAQEQLFNDWRKRQLAAQILCTCPSQIHYFLSQVKPSFEPRTSITWCNAMKFITHFVSLQDVDSFFSGLTPGRDLFPLVKKIQTSFGMFILQKNFIFSAFRSKDIVLVFVMTEWLNIIFKKIQALCELQEKFPEWNLLSVSSELLRFLPSLSDILPILLGDGNSKVDLNQNALPDGVKISFEDYLDKMTDLLVLSCELQASDLETEVPGCFPKLLSFIKSHESAVEENKFNFLLLKVLKLIRPNSSTLHLWQKEVEENCNPLFLVFDLYIRMNEVESSQCVKLLISQLFSTFEDFKGYDWEIEIWLQEIRTLPSDSREQAVHFLCHVVQIFLCYPIQYIDRIMECRLAALGKEFTDKKFSTKMSNEEFLNTLEKQLILSTDCDESTLRSFFTPLVPAAIASFPLKSTFKGSGKYLEAVLLKVLHRQHNPEALCSLFHSANDIFSHRFQNYIHFWHTSSNNAGSHPEDMKTFWKEVLRKVLSSVPREPASLCLMSAFVLFNLEHRSNNMDSLPNVSLALSKAIPSSRTEADELLFQSLLYLQTQLKMVPDDNVADFILILCAFLEKLFSWIYRLTQDDLDKVEVLQRILCCPVLKNWFIIPGDFELSKFNNESVQNCTNFITNFTSSCLSLTTGVECHPKELIITLKPFKDKLLTLIDMICSSDLWQLKSLWTNVRQGVVGCLGMLNFDDVTRILNSVLSLPLSVFKLKSEPFDLIQILMKLVFDSDRTADILQLKTQSVKNMFQFVCLAPENASSDQEYMMPCLLNFLEQNPLFCVAVSQDCFDQLLTKCGPVSLSLIKIICKYNPNQCQRLHKWLKNNLDALVMWPPLLCLQILEVFFIHHQTKLKKDEYLLGNLSNLYFQHINSLMTNWELLNDTNDVSWTTSFLLFLMQNGKIEKALVAVAVEQVLEKNSTCHVVPTLSTVVLLSEVFGIFHTYLISCKVKGLSPRQNLMKLHFQWILILLGDSSTSDLFLLDFASETMSLIQSLLKTEVADALKEMKSWYQFVTALLRKALRCNITGPLLLDILKELCLVQYSNLKESILPSAAELVQLLLSHSAFSSIMLEDGIETCTLKGPIVELWASLAKLDSTCCQPDHFPVLLGSYGATLSPTDQKLFYIMSLYEDSGISMHGFRPFIWGSSAMSYYYSQAKSRLSLWKQPKLEDVLPLLEKEKLYRTCILGPLDLELKPTCEIVILKNLVSPDDSEGTSEHSTSMYDGRFLLIVLNHLVQQGSVVDSEKFVSSQCLAFVLSALSFQDQDLRALAYQVLSLFYQHLESRFNHFNKTWLFILNTLRNAIKAPNVCLSSMVTNFLVKATAVLSKPNDHLYTVIYKFLALKPVFDTGNIPEFYELFYSSDIHYIHHREFLLSLIHEGLRTSLDFHLCQKRFVFPILLSYCTSSLCLPQNKIMILNILNSAIRIRSVALILCKTHSLLAWLQSFIANHIPEKHKDKILSCVVQILETLWVTSKTSKPSKKGVHLKITPKYGEEVPLIGTKDSVCTINDHKEDMASEVDDQHNEMETYPFKHDVEMAASKKSLTTESFEPVDNTAEVKTKQSVHAFYPLFPNELLIACLGVFGAVRNHPEITTLCTCVRISSECFRSLPNESAFLSYLTEDHLQFLLHCTRLESSTKVSSSSSFSLYRICCEHALKIIMLIPPRLYVNCNSFHLVTETLTSYLETAVTDFDFVNSVCTWLVSCLRCDIVSEPFLRIFLQRSNDGSKFMSLLLACTSEYIAELNYIELTSSKMDCLHSLLMLFLVLLPERHKELAGPCSEIAASLNSLSKTVNEGAKLVKLATLLQQTWLEDYSFDVLHLRIQKFQCL